MADLIPYDNARGVRVRGPVGDFQVEGTSEGAADSLAGVVVGGLLVLGVVLLTVGAMHGDEDR